MKHFKVLKNMPVTWFCLFVYLFMENLKFLEFAIASSFISSFWAGSINIQILKRKAVIYKIFSAYKAEGSRIHYSCFMNMYLRNQELEHLGCIHTYF